MTWPLEVTRQSYPDGSTLLVELECDEVAVLHIVETGAPEADTLQVGGTVFKLTGDAQVEQWVYLKDEYAAILRDGLTKLLSIETAVKEVAFGEVDAYTRGLLDGVELFAYTSSEPWAENGVRYVGNFGTTLVKAREDILRERGYVHEARRIHEEATA